MTRMCTGAAEHLRCQVQHALFIL
ncbi:hypothetical protein E2C01_087582 [Portunus trituberculatus]|uniref:Uncharacterized protein n=1 Tax=Portunus trituberculatus TaxID=210409 RepID=A0A5B7J3R8_PORTR|nr:hypothetical protein [Portunus trituberculatus]